MSLIARYGGVFAVALLLVPTVIYISTSQQGAYSKIESSWQTVASKLTTLSDAVAKIHELEAELEKKQEYQTILLRETNDLLKTQPQQTQQTQGGVTTMETRQSCHARLTSLAGETKPKIDWKQWQTPADETNPRQKAFIDIYEKNYWGGGLGSGFGSELGFSIPVRCYLQQLLVAWDIRTIIDAPCGDLWWMSHFLDEHPNVNYVGIDIVPALIAHHRATYKDKANWEFFLGDLTNATLFGAIRKESKAWSKQQGGNVLLLTRHAIEHNTVPDQLKIFRNIHNSGANYILTTSHVETCVQPATENSGGYSPTNFLLPPAKLPKPLEYLHEKGATYLGLWSLPFNDWAPDNV